ncbi:MAG TPA: ABC transporter permease [Gammaproteobacteria bacterium]|nr:ABC transporter permease [Gammaproteobacteria bacterium]
MNLHAVATVFRKETRDNARDRRTLFRVFLFGPLLGPIIFAGMMNAVISMNLGSATKALDLPVAGAQYAPNLIAFLRSHHANIKPAPDDPAAAVKAGMADVVLKIPASYPKDFVAGRPAEVEVVLDAASQSGAAPVRRVKALLNAYSSQLASLRLLARGVNPSATHPLAIVDQDVSTPTARGAMLMGMVPYFCLFATLMGGFYLAIDTTAGERERGSLEPLLGTAASRPSLMLGKLCATAFYSVCALAIAVAAFGVAIPTVPAAELGMQLNFGAYEAMWIFAVCVPFVFLGAAGLTVIAAFSRSFKEAQAWMSVALIVPVLPLIFVAVHPVHSQWWMMLIPSLSQDLLIMTVMKGNPIDGGFFALSIVSTLVVAGVLAAYAMRLYRRERLLV